MRFRVKEYNGLKNTMKVGEADDRLPGSVR